MSHAPYQYPGGWEYGDPRIPPGDPLISPDFNGWWGRGFTIVRKGWRPLLLVQLITAVPALALLIPGQVVADLAMLRLTEQTAAMELPEFGGFFAAFGTLMVFALLAGLVYAIGALVTVRLVVSVATDADTRIGPAVRAALPRLGAVLGWYALAALISVGAALACFFPVIYVAAVFMILPAVVMFERGNAISRCFSLFHHEFGVAISRVATIFGLAMGIGFVAFAVSSLITIAIGAPVLGPEPGMSDAAIITDSAVRTALNGLATAIGGIVMTPLTVATYADLRARREPFRTSDLPAT